MLSISDIPVDVLLDNLLPFIAVPDLLNLACTNRFFAILSEYFRSALPNINCLLTPQSPMILYGNENSEMTLISRVLELPVLVAGNLSTRVWVSHRFTPGGKPLSSLAVISIDILISPSSENTHGRLGFTKPPQTTLNDVPFPIQLRIPGVRIISLIAGGMFVTFQVLVKNVNNRIPLPFPSRSFHALDSEGNVYVWGKLNLTYFASPSWSIGKGTLDGSSFALESDGFAVSSKRAGTPLKLALPAPMRTVR